MIKIENPTELESEIISKLKTVFDPEIPVNIWELGFIYDIKTDENRNVDILMTLTAPNCPSADVIPETIYYQLSTIKNIGKVNINLTFEPEWTTEMMSEEALLDLGML